MQVVESKSYSLDYHDPEKRSIANAVQVFFKDGSFTPNVEVEYPLGHRRRRAEGIPLLIEKFRSNLSTRFSEARADAILDLCSHQEKFEALSVHDFINYFVPEETHG
jgi:2-methylcitrate dehydratase